MTEQETERLNTLAKSAAARLKFDLNGFPKEYQLGALRAVYQTVERMIQGPNVVIDGPGMTRIIPDPVPEPTPEPVTDPVEPNK